MKEMSLFVITINREVSDFDFSTDFRVSSTNGPALSQRKYEPTFSGISHNGRLHLSNYDFRVGDTFPYL